jgi:hypothetical protein
MISSFLFLKVISYFILVFNYAHPEIERVSIKRGEVNEGTHSKPGETEIKKGLRENIRIPPEALDIGTFWQLLPITSSSRNSLESQGFSDLGFFP